MFKGKVFFNSDKILNYYQLSSKSTLTLLAQITFLLCTMYYQHQENNNCSPTGSLTPEGSTSI